jgi:hypothetical protein
MKKLFTLCLVACAAVALFTACKTTSTASGGAATNEVTIAGLTLDPYKVANVIETGAAIGAKVAIAKDANARAYFVAAETVVSGLIHDGDYNSAALSAALDGISVKEIRDNTEVKGAIQSVLALYEVFEGDVVTAQVDKNQWLSLGLQGLDKGLTKAISETAPSQ